MKQEFFDALLLIKKECETHDNCVGCAFCRKGSCLFMMREWPCDWPLVEDIDWEE